MRKLKFFLTLVITVLIITGCASGGKDKPKKDNWNDFQTDKKIVTFLHSRCKYKSSYTSSISITLPSAGDKIASGSVGMLRFGFLKKFTKNNAKINVMIAIL